MGYGSLRAEIQTLEKSLSGDTAHDAPIQKKLTRLHEQLRSMEQVRKYNPNHKGAGPGGGQFTSGSGGGAGEAPAQRAARLGRQPAKPGSHAERIDARSKQIDRDMPAQSLARVKELTASIRTWTKELGHADPKRRADAADEIKDLHDKLTHARATFKRVNRRKHGSGRTELDDDARTRGYSNLNDLIQTEGKRAASVFRKSDEEPLTQDVEKYNPNHFGPGPKGGQFAPGKGSNVAQSQSGPAGGGPYQVSFKGAGGGSWKQPTGQRKKGMSTAQANREFDRRVSSKHQSHEGKNTGAGMSGGHSADQRAGEHKPRVPVNQKKPRLSREERAANSAAKANAAGINHFSDDHLPGVEFNHPDGRKMSLWWSGHQVTNAVDTYIRGEGHRALDRVAPGLRTMIDNPSHESVTRNADYSHEGSEHTLHTDWGMLEWKDK